MEIGTRIKNLRILNNLTLKQLSEKVDISVSFLSDIENNKSAPSLARLKDIALGLNTQLSYLLGEEVCDPVTNTIYNVNDLDIQNEIKVLLKDKYFKEMFPYLKTYKHWSNKDKKELLTYLTIKSNLNKNKKD